MLDPLLEACEAESMGDTGCDRLVSAEAATGETAAVLDLLLEARSWLADLVSVAGLVRDGARSGDRLIEAYSRAIEVIRYEVNSFTDGQELSEVRNN